MRLAAITTLFLTACMPEAEGADENQEQTGCGANELQHLIGQPHDSFDFQSLSQPIRILPPNSMMTLDHNPARLNVDLDADGAITRIWCG